MSTVTNEFSEEINYELNNHLCFNQWRSTSTVIESVKAIENKNVCKFIKFYIAEFHSLVGTGWKIY